jgi:hypothetical protein
VVQNRFELRKSGTYEAELKKPIDAEMKKAEEDVEAATQEISQVEEEYESIRVRKMRGFPIDWSGVEKNPDRVNIVLMKEQRDRFQPHLVGFIRGTGVKLDSNIDLGAPSITLPNLDDTTFGVLQMPPGKSLQLTVTGTYPRLLRFLRSWSGFDRLVKIDNIKISGTSPPQGEIQMQIPLTIYTFPEGIKLTGAAAGGAGAPAAGAGPSAGGGMMGGPSGGAGPSAGGGMMGGPSGGAGPSAGGA